MRLLAVLLLAGCAASPQIKPDEAFAAYMGCMDNQAQYYAMTPVRAAEAAEATHSACSAPFGVYSDAIHARFAKEGRGSLALVASGMAMDVIGNAENRGKGHALRVIAVLRSKQNPH